MIAWFGETRSAVYAGAILAFVNAVIGMGIIEWTIDKENFVFMSAFFGGMAVRIMITLMVFAFMLTEGYHAQTLTFSLLGFYLVFLVQEIVFLVKVLSHHKGYQKARD